MIIKACLTNSDQSALSSLLSYFWEKRFSNFFYIMRSCCRSIKDQAMPLEKPQSFDQAFMVRTDIHNRPYLVLLGSLEHFFDMIDDRVRGEVSVRINKHGFFSFRGCFTIKF